VALYGLNKLQKHGIKSYIHKALWKIIKMETTCIISKLYMKFFSCHVWQWYPYHKMTFKQTHSLVVPLGTTTLKFKERWTQFNLIINN
jgi:hypothetical protein